MDTQTALRVLRSTIFKPGWQIHAVDLYAGHVYVQFLIDTVDTSKPSSDGAFRHRVEILPPGRVINVRNLRSVEELMFEVLKLAGMLDEHEDREFLQVRGSDGAYYAPLHPHTDQGRHDWVALGGDPRSQGA